MTPFPHPLDPKQRRIIGKPGEYRGFTIWRYQLWCQQTGAASGEWRDMAVAVNGQHEFYGGFIYSDIDATLDTK